MFSMNKPTVKLIAISLFGIALSSHAAEQVTRAILLNSIQGPISQTSSTPVKLLITQGNAKGCVAQGVAFLNPKRLRYEFNLEPVNCVKNGHKIPVGTVVRGQHNIKGTMANSGMGRKYLISNKGVTVTLAEN
ncbi:hypothetical protein [Thiomicrorhabdus immobilis]|nr:hypothetical protein [Thiomicrorhabdus immobilis]